MWNDYADGPGLTTPKIGSTRIVLIVELLGLFPYALPHALADGFVAAQRFGDIGGGDVEFPGNVIDRRAFSAVHVNFFNVEIRLNS